MVRLSKFMVDGVKELGQIPILLPDSKRIEQFEPGPRSLFSLVANVGQARVCPSTDLIWD